MANTKKTKKRVDSRQIAFTRFMLIVALFGFWILGIGARLVHLQVSQHDWLRERAVDQRQDLIKTKLLRGTIYDRDEHPLAMSVKVETLYADPTEITDVDGTAKAIAKVLKTDAAELARSIRTAQKGSKRYVPVAKKLDDDIVQKVNKGLYDPAVKKADEPQFAGLHWVDDQKRSYPYETLAAQVIGFSNIDDEGRAGIEQSQDDLLHGAVIKRIEERDRLGRVYDETTFERERPGDVVLTLSTSLQYKTEQALEEGVKASQARSGMAIAMDPKTGEILAMANYPSFDPNSIRDAQPANISNNTIQGSYSPGSVFKLVTYSSALERSLIRPDDMIDAGNGTIAVAGHTFRDSHHIGSVTYADALAHSSNVCAIKTGMRVGRDDFYAMVQKMGFGARTGIELPAETSGIVRDPKRWNGDSLASMAIGYEIGVTALQMTSAFATIANDGVRVQPHLIKEIRKEDSPPVRPQLADNTRVVTAQTAQDLRRMLKQVVLSGTGRRAQLDGYTCAGKTGTAWKFDAKTKTVDPSKYISSFIGMAPADDPKVVIAVVMDEPRVGARDGGMVAAPVFKRIAEQILLELGVAKDQAGPKEPTLARDIPETPDGETKAPSDSKPDAKAPAASSSQKPKSDKPKKSAADGPQALKAAGNTTASVDDSKFFEDKRSKRELETT